MALQLRYFKPSSRRPRGPAGDFETSFSTLSLGTLVPTALRSALKKFGEEEEEEEEEEEVEEGGERGEEGATPEVDTTGGKG